ncbi:right-handed parallel beta-helix repeat-containing protein [Chitinophaga sp. sic0106]|uniref:right-handed parallel beta-helix repeat-containing protein n=1 Tax=Chitinophaga sp. sic0106 TaxID=2854785 RepID=UPI001C48EE12|nr:right-handed parallel beta-helix repeat-containing protein [Chitinophaga sp. sic0106]MBV7531489.1 peptide-binding protein [Chitinophaga sp. sic0106]
MRQLFLFFVHALLLVIFFSPAGAQDFVVDAHPNNTVQVIRQYRTKYPDCNLTIRYKPGTYYLDSTIVIPAALTNGKGYTIIQGNTKETVTISGGKALTVKWQPYKNGIYRAPVNISWDFDQLYVDGSAAVRARYPNYDSTASHYNGYAEDALSKARIASWRHPAGGYIHALHRAEWGGYHYRITGVNPDTSLQLSGGYQNNRQMGMHKTIRYVENIFEELDTAREWYYDKAQRFLYYKPAGGKAPAAGIVVSRWSGYIILQGDAKAPVQRVTVKDIRFTQAKATFMETREPLLRSDWAIYRGGVILLDGTRDCTVQHCVFEQNGGNAIFLSNFNRHAMVTGNRIQQLGGNAIAFVGNPDAVRSPLFEYNGRQDFAAMDTASGPKTDNYPDSCAAVDNLIHDIGLIEKQVAGVQISMSAHVQVSHNSIYNLPRAGINISEGTWGGHVIEYNDVFNTVLETGDHGSFNSWGRDRWWYPNRKEMDSIAALYPWLIKQDAVYTNIIRYNRFRCDHGWDIDLDDGSSNYEIYGNVCLHGGLKLREGFDRKVYNNIIVNNSFHPHVWFKNSGDVFTNNIVMTRYKPIGINYWGKEVDRNFFPDSISLANAQANGTDAHSAYGDPQFANPAAGDYTVRNPAAKDFKNFNQHAFGVSSPALRAMAARPVFPAPGAGNETATASWQWQNGTFKNLETLGERSATGMADYEGVLVLKAPNPAMGLRDGDVILLIGPHKVRNTHELQQVLKTAAYPLKLTIFRNQQQMAL